MFCNKYKEKIKELEETVERFRDRLNCRNYGKYSSFPKLYAAILNGEENFNIQLKFNADHRTDIKFYVDKYETIRWTTEIGPYKKPTSLLYFEIVNKETGEVLCDITKDMESNVGREIDPGDILTIQ